MAAPVDFNPQICNQGVTGSNPVAGTNFFNGLRENRQGARDTSRDPGNSQATDFWWTLPPAQIAQCASANLPALPALEQDLYRDVLSAQ
jgi:hypothetical protein